MDTIDDLLDWSDIITKIPNDFFTFSVFLLLDLSRLLTTVVFASHAPETNISLLHFSILHSLCQHSGPSSLSSRIGQLHSWALF